mmetsp:Transcript_28517/g.54415  ORF Transcript_28517/g.54415 Transcript_28517/m.54415 type:complete len:213 (-) Transcript_28517:752-1390(-)
MISNFTVPLGTYEICTAWSRFVELFSATANSTSSPTRGSGCVSSRTSTAVKWKNMSSWRSWHLMKPKLLLTIITMPNCFFLGGSFTTTTRVACFTPAFRAPFTIQKSTSAPTARTCIAERCFVSTSLAANVTVAVPGPKLPGPSLSRGWKEMTPSCARFPLGPAGAGTRSTTPRLRSVAHSANLTVPEGSNLTAAAIIRSLRLSCFTIKDTS